METIEKYKGRNIVVKQVGEGLYRAFLRQVGRKTDFDPGIESESTTQTIAQAKEFVDAIPVLQWGQ